MERSMDDQMNEDAYCFPGKLLQGSESRSMSDKEEENYCKSVLGKGMSDYAKS